MLLAIHVGNTSTVLGVVRDREVVHNGRIRTVSRTTDELGILLVQLLGNRRVLPQDLKGVICSSVVPSQVYTIEKACRRYLNLECQFVGRRLKTGMKVRTDNPREVGADRIVHAVAAMDLVGGPVVVVSLGTATTVDCVNRAGEYVGGAIAPGFGISEEALFARTARLPRVEVSRPATAIGPNTVHAIQSGLFWGYVGLVDGLARRCRDALDADAPVIATGPMASLFAPECTVITDVSPFLAFQGLALLWERNNRP